MTMTGQKFAAVASLIFVVIFALGIALPIRAQRDKTPYPTMAPLDQYLMDRDAEIALARSAAPDAISRDATVLVLGPHGYETAVEGKNGFVCLVKRGGQTLSTTRSIGAPRTAVRFATTRRPRAASCRSIL